MTASTSPTALRSALCPPHPLVGQRPGLSPDQLDHLSRSALDAGDRFAASVITIAMIPTKFGWKALPPEPDAMAYAIDAWEGRCRRTGGKPWTRTVIDPGADRPCPGCGGCAGGGGR